MKIKYLLLSSLFLITSSFSDILYVKKKRCILDTYYFQNNNFHYTYSSSGSSYSTQYFKSKDLEYGYIYLNNKCQKIQILKDTHMTYHDYKFMIALTGLLLGFLIFTSVIFIFIKKD